jgi:hypothetical protein
MMWLSALALVGLAVMIYGAYASSHHLLTYQIQVPTVSVNNDLTANVDAEFSQRNGHYLFSENYQLLAIAVFGNDLVSAKMTSPTLNAVTQFNVNPLNDSSISLSPPRMDFWTHAPVPLPMNEEIQIGVTGTSADTFPITCAMIIAPVGNWSNKLPVGITPVPVFEMAFTATPTLNNNQWSTLALPTFNQNLRGGTYAVVGFEMQGTGLLCGRIVFPQAPLINNRRMRPGCIASNAIGDQTLALGQVGPFWLGEYGRFSTAELPSFEFLGLGTSTITVTGVLRLVRLSENINVTYGQ